MLKKIFLVFSAVACLTGCDYFNRCKFERSAEHDYESITVFNYELRHYLFDYDGSQNVFGYFTSNIPWDEFSSGDAGIRALLAGIPNSTMHSADQGEYHITHKRKDGETVHLIFSYDDNNNVEGFGYVDEKGEFLIDEFFSRCDNLVKDVNMSNR